MFTCLFISFNRFLTENLCKSDVDDCFSYLFSVSFYFINKT